jgi:hypothetical protein
MPDIIISGIFNINRIDMITKAMNVYDSSLVRESVYEYETKKLTIHSVSFSLPTNDEIEKQAEKALFGFGKGRQYDDDYWTGYEEGAKWIIDKCNKS